MLDQRAADEAVTRIVRNKQIKIAVVARRAQVGQW
jgi:hypothetical protein